jgi:hypothetical protein
MTVAHLSPKCRSVKWSQLNAFIAMTSQSFSLHAGCCELNTLCNRPFLLAVRHALVDVKELRQGAFDGSVVQSQRNEAALLVQRVGKPKRARLHLRPVRAAKRLRVESRCVARPSATAPSAGAPSPCPSSCGSGKRRIRTPAPYSCDFGSNAWVDSERNRMECHENKEGGRTAKARGREGRLKRGIRPP